MRQVEKTNAFLGIASFYTKADETTPYGMDRINNLVRFATSRQGASLLQKVSTMGVLS